MRLGCTFCKGRHSSLKAGSQEVRGIVVEDPSGCLPPSPASPASAILLESTWSVLLSRSVEMPDRKIRNFTCFKQLWPLTKIVLQIWLFKGKFLGQNKIVSFAIFYFLKNCWVVSVGIVRQFLPGHMVQGTFGPGDTWSRGHMVLGTFGSHSTLLCYFLEVVNEGNILQSWAGN